MISAVFRDERGSVFALAAFVIPVLLLLSALMVDVGHWYVHNRQLQTRADAGALAAGVDYSANWAACMQDADATLKASTAAVIEMQARLYAGDPSVGSVFNTEIAAQSRLHVVLNSTSFAAGSDRTDGGGPCARHAGDAISPAGGYWMDVRVQERNLSSLFGAFGLPLAHTQARARIEIHPAVSDNGFIPLAVPETEIEEAQVRYYNECASPRSLLASANLKPLDRDYQTVPGTVLWGPDTGLPRIEPSSITLPVPPSADCGEEYIPIGVEVRVAGRDALVDIDQPCDVLVAARFADCWPRLSQVRAFLDNPETVPWFQQVELTSSGTSSTCTADAYFARNTGHCDYSAVVRVDWNDMAEGDLDVADNFSLTVNGTPLSPVDPTSANGMWVSDGPVDNATHGASAVLVSWSWEDNDPSHSWGGEPCTHGNHTPCKGSGGDVPVQRAFLATDDNAGVVDLIRTSQAPQPPAGQPGFVLHSVEAGTGPITIYPTIGLRSALTAGQYRVLRAAGPQGNQSVDCEPSGGQGHDFQMFLNGCQPFYGFNRFGPPDAAVWWTKYGDCPNHTEIFAQPNGPSGSSAWKCVPSAPGFTAGVMADGIAARTGNCDSIQNNSCARTSCNFPSRYPETPDPEWAPAPGDPRVVNLFVVPYGAFKGINAQDGLPITQFPRFYVTGWGGNGSNDDPCPDDDPAEPGEIVGYFIAFGEPGGPVDDTMDCIVGDLTPCRAVLVY